MVAIGVAVIAYFQWRTAHQRIVIDLFERRFQVYEDLRKVIFEYATNFEVTNLMLGRFLVAREWATFLFGSEVTTYLEECYKDLTTVNVFRGLPVAPGPDYQDQQRQLKEADRRLVKYLISLRC